MRSFVVLVALAACSPGLGPSTFPTGSSTLAVADDGGLYSLDPDGGAVVALTAGGEVRDAMVVGVDPVRLVVAGDHLFVSVRGEGVVAVLADDGVGLSEIARIPVGAEPYGLVATRDGGSVFVAVSMEDEVVEIDVNSHEIVGRHAVGGQPRWLALHPRERALYVGSAMGGGLAHIDLGSGEVKRFTAPDRERFEVDVIGVPFTPRITGDLSVAAHGEQLAVPVLYVDTSRPHPARAADDGPSYGNSGSVLIDRTTPAVVLYQLDRSTAPQIDTAQVVPAVALADRSFGAPARAGRRSDLSSVTFSPDGLMVMATMASSNAVLALPAVLDDEFDASTMGDLDSLSAVQDGFSVRPIQTLLTRDGPRGVAFGPNDIAFVDNVFEHTVQRVPYGLVFDRMHGVMTGSAPEATVPGGEFPWIELGLPWRVADPTLPPDVELGRAFFFTALEARVSAHGSGTACATCHFDARTDGLTWELPNGRLQTPSLSGPVSLTAPVTWLSSVPTVADEALLTSEGRMGGEGLSRDQAEAIALYLDSTAYPAAPTLDPRAVARGEQIFAGSAQCASCHTGALYTDNEPYTLFGAVDVRTPTLRGLAASAPYLHDGRASTLDDLVDMAEAGGMGRTEHLSDAERADLVAFLRSL